MLRVIDSSVNRVCEGFRVVEDISRFKFNNEKLSSELKSLRHSIRSAYYESDFTLLNKRDVPSDFGIEMTEGLGIERPSDLKSLICGNFKRIQEGLRTLEEMHKVEGSLNVSLSFERIRYQSYILEKEMVELLESEKLQLPPLYGITYLKGSNGRDNITIVKEMIEAGITIIQYREKDLTLLEKYRECMEIRQLTRDAGVLFIVNDHIDIALVTDADGIHIGQDDLPVKKARELMGRDKIIGLSTHSPQQALNAVESGADYIGVGPIFSTQTKVNVCDPVGLDYLRWVKNNITIPYVTIGGIKEHNLESVLENGAYSVAIVSEITGCNNIKEKVNTLTKKIKEFRYEI